MNRLDLDAVVRSLEGHEETIIARFIDRAQYLRNTTAYVEGQSGFPNEPSASLLDIRLRHQESMDAVFGRFLVPEERPFTRRLPQPSRRPPRAETALGVSDFEVVSLADEIRGRYLALLPRLCEEGDDGHHGSAVEHDVAALQAIGRRIHYGSIYVAECKYQERPKEYAELIRTGDREGLLDLLTRPEVERRIVLRVTGKVLAMQAPSLASIRRMVAPEVVSEFYRSAIFPLTKEGELRYLLARRTEAS